ncbi:MAG: DUF2232 domain-containing protein [Synergistaceae bacterium]|nr:DUF2232 domain-containing protein [Synergistaceae bacterium]
MKGKNIIICVVITLALILAGTFLPVLGFIGLMICPLPLAVLGCLEGYRSSGIAELLIEATLFFVLSPSMALYYLLGCAPLAAVIFMISRSDIKQVKKFTAPESLLFCAGSSLLMKVILLVVFWLFAGRNILFPDISQMDAVLSQLYAEQPALQQAVRQILFIFPYMLPAMLVIYIAIESYLNYSMTSSIMRKYFKSCKNFPPVLPDFKLWRFPVSLMPALVFSLIMGYFIDPDKYFIASTFAINLQIILNIFMFIQGLALIFWLMSGFKLRRVTKILICLVLTIPFFWPWLIIAGMCDMALNLRERIKTRE